MSTFRPTLPWKWWARPSTTVHCRATSWIPAPPPPTASPTWAISPTRPSPRCSTMTATAERTWWAATSAGRVRGPSITISLRTGSPALSSTSRATTRRSSPRPSPANEPASRCCTSRGRRTGPSASSCPASTWCGWKRPSPPCPTTKLPQSTAPSSRGSTAAPTTHARPAGRPTTSGPSPTRTFLMRTRPCGHCWSRSSYRSKTSRRRTPA